MSSELEKTLINKALEAEATKRGAIDGSVGHLANRELMFVGSDGEVYGVEDAIDGLAAAKPAFFKQVQKIEPQATVSNDPLKTTEENMRAIGRQEMKNRQKAFTEKYGGSQVSESELDGIYNGIEARQASKTLQDREKEQDWVNKW